MDTQNGVENKSKRDRCMYCHLSTLKLGEYYCAADGWEKLRFVTRGDCESCGRFNSRYIEYPITINGIDNEKIDISGLGHECGCLCEVKPCGEEYGDKLYIGFYLGDLPILIYSSFNNDTGILKNHTMNNPAIFVPELKKIVYGCESWWREINSIEDFEGISKEDIDNTWYVKLLKQIK